jgi:uncharacterized transporter YbjL
MDYLAPGMVAQAVLALSVVAALGLVLGSLGFRGIRLGAAGVLFAGLLLGQTCLHIDQNILEFVRDFGLILFVYTVGLQVGPSFFSSLKRRGLQLNVLASTSSAWRSYGGGFPVDPKKATAELGSAVEIDSQIPDYIDLEVTNPNCDGIALRNLPFMEFCSAAYQSRCRGCPHRSG